MDTFDSYNPVVIAVYFLSTAGIAMFSMHPILLVLSLSGSFLLFLCRNGLQNGRTHLYALVFFCGASLINPLFHHNGATVLFVINHNPITWEALAYGIAAAVMILSVLYWFRSFSQIMTDDKLLYLLRGLSPKLAMIITMALRFVPMFAKQAEKINQTQTALGLYREDSIVDRFRGGIRVFSVLLTWALENGIITADSMAARGYGTQKRSQFSIFSVRASDIVFLCTTILLFLITCAALACGAMEITFYPTISVSDNSVMTLVGCIAYGMLAFLPCFVYIKDMIIWNCLQSKI